jgi:alkanesulfonate monooxygenase SsuD/methylene tetrahydromethanopterin reductase-like flavin-dependent oxidoreductase (luciferase family)
VPRSWPSNTGSSKTLIAPRAYRWPTRTSVNRFCHITNSKEDGLRFAENARYQSRLASSLRRRQEVMQGTVLVDKPFPDEPPLEQIYNDLLIGDVETVAEKLAAEIRATHPAHMCFSFKVGATPHKAAMRSMELMMSEVGPRVERALGPLARSAAE